jgi:hypothetical protein
VTIRLADGSTLALAQVRAYRRVVRGRPEEVRPYARRYLEDLLGPVGTAGTATRWAWLGPDGRSAANPDAHFGGAVLGNIAGAVIAVQDGHAVVDGFDGNRYLTDLEGHIKEVMPQGAVPESLRNDPAAFIREYKPSAAPVDRSHIRGWIPEQKWLEGQQLWKQRGRAAGAADEAADEAAAKGVPSNLVKNLPPLEKPAAKPPPEPAGKETGHVSPILLERPAYKQLQREVTSGLSGSEDPNQPHSGVEAETTVLDLEDGSKVVRKKGEESDELQAELLAYAVSQAIGAGVPAVVQSGRDEITEEFVPGTTMMEWIDNQAGLHGGDYISDSEAGDELAATREGKMIGLLDYLIVNHDRHYGNVIVRPDDIPVPIDHGLTFFSDLFPTDSPFWAYNREEWEREAGTLAAMIPRLKEIKPEFVSRGQEAWYAGMMGRMQSLLKEARRQERGAGKGKGRKK